ncbi:MAG: DUF1801 domain-containing protein [Polyangiaceae bacterium]
MKTDPRVSAYIAKAPPFAQAILAEVRERVAKANPAIVETIKWNVPFFLLDGKILASSAAFKKHVKVGVWIGMKPTFQDLSDVSELMSTNEFGAKLAAAAEESGSAMSSGPAKAPAKKAPAKKAPAKKAPAKRAAK